MKFIIVDRELKFKSLIQEVFQENYARLVVTLPMNDDIFMAELYVNKLLPHSLKQKIEALPSSTEKAVRFLDSVIQPSVANNNCAEFHVLLNVMKNHDTAVVNVLADRIRYSLNETGRLILNRGLPDDKTST